jgi:hypothetical protein
MKKFTLIIIAFTACTQQAPEFPVNEFHPLAKSYVKNEITGYLKLWSFQGKLEKQDSVRINNQGLETDRISVSGHWYSVTNYQFDSLNRMIEMFHESDIKYNYGISYAFNSDNRILEQLWKDIGPSDTVELWNHKYFYEESLNQPTKMVRLSNDLDTISVTHYSYSDYGIQEIFEIGDVTTFKTSFVYNKDSTLAKVIKEHNNINFEPNFIFRETDFISSKTGLIDSTVNTSKGTYYYEYF